MHGYQYVEEYLRSEGFRLTEEDNHFFVKYQGGNYIFFKNDSMFVQITMILNTENYDFETCLRACNEFNSNKFVVKFTATPNNTVWCSYEFIPHESTPNDEYEMIFDYLDRASDEYFKALQGGKQE